MNCLHEILFHATLENVLTNWTAQYSDITNENESKCCRASNVYLCYILRFALCHVHVKKSRSLQKNIAERGEGQKRDSFKRNDAAPGRDPDLDGRPGDGPQPRPHRGDRVREGRHGEVRPRVLQTGDQ